MKIENSKEKAGRKKCPLHLLSPSAMRETAYVLASGASKYGQRNWRDAGINASTYHGALLRHIQAWADGEDLDPESGLSHIAHAAACCDILLDSMACGMMNDDRSKKPTPEEAAERMSRSVLREVTPGKPVPCVSLERRWDGSGWKHDIASPEGIKERHDWIIANSAWSPESPNYVLGDPPCFTDPNVLAPPVAAAAAATCSPCACCGADSPKEGRSDYCHKCWKAVVEPALDYVELLTPDIATPFPAWHGWAIRKAFIAGAASQIRLAENDLAQTRRAGD